LWDPSQERSRNNVEPNHKRGQGFGVMLHDKNLL